MRNRNMFITLVTIIVAMYIGMWVFVGISPRTGVFYGSKAQVGKSVTVTLVNEPKLAVGIFEGKDDQWLYLVTDTNKNIKQWVPIAQIVTVRFKE